MWPTEFTTKVHLHLWPTLLVFTIALGICADDDPIFRTCHLVL